MNICRFCNIPRNSLDDPYQRFWLTDSAILASNMSNNYEQTARMGYYPMKNNIFHELLWCHEFGVNQLTPVEPLHCILLGLFIGLLQGFNRLRKPEPPERTALQASLTCEQEEGKTISTKIPPLPQLVFTGLYKDEVVKKELERIGFMLHQPSDDNMPHTYFPSGYLPDANNKDDSSNGGKFHMKCN